ncbi:MAG: TraB/GumN family protein [Brevundimonas sp.]
MRAWWVSGLAAVVLSTVQVSPARADPPLWRVSDADTEMVLFGSVHALPPGVAWRTDSLDRALAAADLVVFEILTPETEEEEMAMMLPMLRYLMGAQPLSATVSEQTLARARLAAEAQDLDPQVLEMFRPWAAAFMLEMGADEALGRSGDLGVDTAIETGLPEGRRTEALDTDALLHASMAALAEDGDAEGEELLIEVLDSLDEAEDALDMTLETAWLAGDLEPIRVEMESMKAEAPRLHQVLLVDRNHGWMPALRRIMETEGRVVVIVGVAHMVGEDGLPTLLRQAGYTVEGP